jgi:NAD(P)-dependent dehydrogenase (short-subunit alcohol dehydrogenase family)
VRPTSVEADVVRLFRTVDEELGRLTALVNNAGILDRQMKVESMNAARMNRIFATNITGSFLCAREAVLRMSTRHGGSGGAIVNVSSGAARLGSPGEYVDYAASKGAVDTMTIGLAREVAEEGIRVNAVRPGFIYTRCCERRADRVTGSSARAARNGRPRKSRTPSWAAFGRGVFTGTFIDSPAGDGRRRSSRHELLTCPSDTRP